MLTVVEKVIFLQNVDLFEQIPTEQLAYLAVIAEEVSIEKETTIYSQNDTPDALYLVLEGQVRLHVDEREITVSKAKDAFGSWALFDNSPRVTSATTIEDTKLLVIDREDFIDLLADNIQITESILKTMVLRLRNLVERVGVNPSRFQSNTEER